MPDLKTRIFNLFDQYGSTKGFCLKDLPTVMPGTGLWRFTFTNGLLDRQVAVFEEVVTRDASCGALSEETKRNIDAELAPPNES
jgi:hypothetical protein